MLRLLLGDDEGLERAESHGVVAAQSLEAASNHGSGGSKGRQWISRMARALGTDDPQRVGDLSRPPIDVEGSRRPVLEHRWLEHRLVIVGGFTEAKGARWHETHS